MLIDSYDTRRRLARFAPDAHVKLDAAARHYLPDQTDTILAFLKDGVPARVA